MLRIALVGCGRISTRHAQLLGEQQIKGAKLVAVCDRVLDKAQPLAEKYDVPAFEDMHQMMQDIKPDAVAVLTESGLHAETTIELAQYGAHIIVEKPMALTLRDADRMIEACDAANAKLFIIKQNRFNVPVQKLREAVEAGRFGKFVLGWSG